MPCFHMWPLKREAMKGERLFGKIVRLRIERRGGRERGNNGDINLIKVYYIRV